MAEYFDLGVNLLTMADVFFDRRKYWSFSSDKQQADLSRKSSSSSKRQRHRKFFDPSLYQVRQSICVAGVSQDAVLKVKNFIAGLSVEPLALESFHVKCANDVKDGALLVPKVILAATHCPGKKLIDNTASDGQLDCVYDELCRVGADALLVCVDLPRILYPPNKSRIYHQRFAELLFKAQPILETLALENSLITVTENTKLNHIQRNVIWEWISKPVGKDHYVYQAAADYLTEAENQRSDVNYWSETEVYHRQRVPHGLTTGWSSLARGFLSGTEDDPRTTGRRMKTKRKKNRSYGAVGNNEDSQSELRSLLESTSHDSHELLLFSDDNLSESNALTTCNL